MSYIEDLGMQAGSQAVSGALGGIMGLLMEKHNDQRQLDQQTKLQALQISGNKQMMDYQQKLAYENWLKTNYSAQMEQLQKAGLNPGLIYGMGGGGGATMGAPSGNVSGASAQQNPAEVQQFTGMGLQLGMQAAQMRLIEAQARATEIHADKEAGIDTQKTATEIESLKTGMKTQEAQQAMMKADTFLKNLQGTFEASTMEDRIKQISWNLKQTMAQVGIAENEEYISDQTLNDKIKLIHQEAIGSVLRNALTQAQTDATRQGIQLSKAEIEKIQAEIPAIQAQIAQKWVELQQGGTRLDIEQQRTEIQRFGENIKANYPGIGQTLGRLVNDGIEAIFNTVTGTDRPARTQGPTR